MIKTKSRLLEQRFQRMFPAARWERAYAWAGTFGESKDGLAYVGETPECPDAYFALAYGGNGITFDVIAARIIRDLYLGRPNADAAVFRFGR
jgi:glycine/D-amino acid oxidase-like deaminating enzyme